MTTQTTDDTIEAGGEPAAGPIPFLRITATYPVADARVQTIELELNLRDDDPVVETADEPEPDRDGMIAVQSWINSIVRTTISSMCQNSRPTIVLAGRGADLLAHAKDCDGTCDDNPQPAGDDRGGN